MASAVVRSRKSRSGITGSTATLASTYSAAAMIARPTTTMAYDVAEAQANWVPASETHTSSTETPPTIRVAPR